MNDFTIGTCIGLVQTFVGHPLDTIKTNYQNNLKYKINFNKLHYGLRYPMMSTVITNSLLFSLIPLHDNEKCFRYYQLIT